MKITGTLYVIGAGPGDPELLTLKAVRILRKVKCICVPKGREEGSSIALSIVKKALDLEGKEIIEAYFPMRKTKNRKKTLPRQPSLTKGGDRGGDPSLSVQDADLDAQWNDTVETVLRILEEGTDMAFITIGDPTIYSTFFYLQDKLIELNPTLSIEIIPGISSINASAAKAGISLGLADEKIAVLPATYIDDISGILERFDTVVLMKVNRAFDKVLETLIRMGLDAGAVYVSRAGMEDEKIMKDIRKVKEGDLNYFSMVIVKK